jgi:hypothetical protein
MGGSTDRSGAPEHSEFGDAWVYESLFGALPGVNVPTWAALALQFGLFEAGVLVLAYVYGLPEGAVVGTVAVALATAGSIEMLRISSLVREADAPDDYRKLLFGSSIEVALGVFAFVALVTYLFVVDPRTPGTLVDDFLGPDPPILATYLMLLVLWDVCYRIGTGWWASVAGLWRSYNYRLDPASARLLARADLETLGFGLLQLVLVPFVLDQPVLLFAVVGHVVAVVTVTGLSLALLRVRTGTDGSVTT